MKKVTAIPILAVFTTLGLSMSAQAALVATDLNTGGTDTGFSGGWAGSANRIIITASDLIYQACGITQTGAVQRVYGGNSTHPDRMDSRDLAVATYSDSTIDFTDSIVRIGVPLWVSGLDTADAIYLSNTETAFFDVTGVPEPSAALLGGLGLLALLRRRR